ncbi:purine-binding chemotaxis protein CheW [Gluconobacter sp. NFX36]|uniref:chemotaxis protein CheW n=1 Tax=Gluconobacter sp. NFX36 TaxID=2819535 RepID=UPI003CF87BB3
MNKILIFTSCNQEYAIDIESVREIRNWTQATPIPSSPFYIEGIINIRGTVIPLVDFCKKINKNNKEYDKKAIIIVDCNNKKFSFSVNNVSDIIELNSYDVKNIPDIGHYDIYNFIDGVISIDSRVIFILNIKDLIKECLN